MRNATKLKNLLHKYTVSLDMSDDEIFHLMLTEKANHDREEFQGKSYSDVLGKAHSHLLKELRDAPPMNEFYDFEKP